jgi:hypothetical protein
MELRKSSSGTMDRRREIMVKMDDLEHMTLFSLFDMVPRGKPKNLDVGG